LFAGEEIMIEANRQLVRDFFTALGRGELPDDMLTADMTAWTITSGPTEKVRFQGAVKMLGSIFGDSLVYDIDALTCAKRSCR
jgi:uncharacterized protein